MLPWYPSASLLHRGSCLLTVPPETKRTKNNAYSSFALGWGCGLRNFSKKEGKHVHTCLCCFLLTSWNTLNFNQATVNQITQNRQYLSTLSRALTRLTQNSCKCDIEKWSTNQANISDLLPNHFTPIYHLQFKWSILVTGLQHLHCNLIRDRRCGEALSEGLALTWLPRKIHCRGRKTIKT